MHSRYFGLALCICVFPGPALAGYTQYFNWHSKPSDAAVRECIAEMRLVVEARRSMLAGPESEGAPELNATSLAIDGIGEDGHEPFLFPGTIEHTPPIAGVPLGFNFCKTAGKPYDAVVTACLLVARDHFPASVLAIGSDGAWVDGDWKDGAELYTAVLHRPANNPVDGELNPGEPTRRWDSNQPYTLPPSVLPLAGIGIAVAIYLARHVRHR
jgi:hypothetical protein